MEHDYLPFKYAVSSSYSQEQHDFIIETLVSCFSVLFVAVLDFGFLLECEQKYLNNLARS